MNLKHLADKHGTDKSHHGHNYMPFYETHLPGKVTSLLEIGVKEGRSMNVWQEAYPHADLYGLDLFTEHPMPEMPGVTFFKGNQLDHDLLYHIRNDVKPQVIIDDGSHNSRDQWVTMLSLIAPDTYYFIEDLDCCNEEFYRQGLPFERTVLGCMLSGSFPFWYHLSKTQKIAIIKC